MNNPHIIVALDCPSEQAVFELVDKLDPQHCRLKIGKALFTQYGPTLVKKLMDSGFDVFLDLKFHDIPNTVAMACKAAASMGVWMLNVHAMGGKNMLLAAREAIDHSSHKPLLIAVTVLTSLHSDDLSATGMGGNVDEHVMRLARFARECGLDGIVCSARESKAIKAELGRDFYLVAPGIRPSGTGRDDQQRIATPFEAIKSGSDQLVIGRPITQAADPMQALIAISHEVKAALG